jgi:hypothetical protein
VKTGAAMGTLSANASRTAAFFFWLMTVKTRAMDLRTTLLQFHPQNTSPSSLSADCCSTHLTCTCTREARQTHTRSPPNPTREEQQGKTTTIHQPACPDPNALSFLPQAHQQLKYRGPDRHAKSTKEKKLTSSLGRRRTLAAQTTRPLLPPPSAACVCLRDRWMRPLPRAVAPQGEERARASARAGGS